MRSEDSDVATGTEEGREDGRDTAMLVSDGRDMDGILDVGEGGSKGDGISNGGGVASESEGMTGRTAVGIDGDDVSVT